MVWKHATLTSGEAGVLDVVQVLADSVPSAPTPGLVSGVALRRVRARRKRVAVNDDSARNR